MIDDLSTLSEQQKFILDKIYRRSDLHDKYGGSRQSGISPSANYPIIFLFTGESGAQFGYNDGWENGVFHYTGEGQEGDMEFSRGNLAIKEHLNNRKELQVFEQQEKANVKYIGQMVCTDWYYKSGPDKNGINRRVIVFKLIPISGFVDDKLPTTKSKSKIKNGISFLKALSDAKEIAACYKEFEKAMAKGNEVNAKFGWSAGSTQQNVVWHSSLNIWNYFDPEWRDFPNKCYGALFGIGNPTLNSMNDISLEINYDHNNPRKSVGGRFLKDESGRFFIGHSGKIGGGKKGIGKDAFLDFYNAQNMQTVLWEQSDSEEVIILGTVEDPHFPAQVAAFVREVAEFKTKIKQGSSFLLTTLSAKSSPIFTPEFQGEKTYTKKPDTIVASCNHGLVISRLKEEIENLGYIVANDQCGTCARDLFIPSTGNEAKILFEVKTDVSPTSIYTAIGQLMFHGARQKDSPIRILVIPEIVDNETSNALSKLEIKILTYEMDIDGVRFPKIIKVVENI